MAGPWDEMLASLWRKDNRVYRAVCVIDSPAVTIEDVESGHRFTLVIGSRQYEEYMRYTPDGPVEA